MQTAIQMQSNNKLTIDKSAYFDVEKKQLLYKNQNWFNAKNESDAYNSVNRYALVRKDNGHLLGIHTDDYIIRPYSELAEKVNEVIVEAVPDYERFTITPKDQVLEGGKKFIRTINFWDDAIDINNYKDGGFHIKGTEEKIIPQFRIYSSMD